LEEAMDAIENETNKFIKENKQALEHTSYVIVYSFIWENKI
jgi:hypothetical protein